MTKFSSLLLITFCSAICAQGQALEFSNDGVLTVANSEWGTLHMDAKWHPNSQSGSLAIDSSSARHWSGSFLGANERPIFDYHQSMETVSDGIRLSAKAEASEGFEANMLAYQGTLPVRFYAGATIHLDGQPIQLPQSYEGQQNIAIQDAREVQVPTSRGTLRFRGDYTVMIVDGRKFGGDRFYLRFFYSPHKGRMQESRFATEIHFEPHAFDPVPLQAVANRGFTDPVGGDGRGGWTDQGPRKDLSDFSAKSPLKGEIPFEIAEGERTTLVVSRDKTRSDKSFAEISLVGEGEASRYLYLLHASAYTWGDVGQIKVTYADGSEQRIEVKASRDVGNWWNPTPFSNAALGWTGKVPEANVGLYISRFELENKAVRAIAFGAGGEPIWMIVAATLSSSKWLLPQPDYFEVRADENWQPIEVPLTIEAGSALDFSRWTDAPAGRHGPVITTEQGDFAFASKPAEPVRFWGTNLNFTANFLPKAEADSLALRLRQMGYNSVRIHHYDVLLADGWDPKDYRIDPAKLDQLHYLFHAMKAQGLYISTDLFTIRRNRNPELAAYDGNSHAVYKALVPILPAAMEDWKEFARDFLTHTNPYTGMTWAEDPALFSIAPVNEDTLWAAINASPKVRALYEAGFDDWLQSHPRPTGTEPERATAFNEFVATLHIRADAAMKRFLREELGCEALVTGNNWRLYKAQTPIRSQYDYVDNHAYWDHPNFPTGPWKYPFSHSQRSATANLADVPRQLFLTQIKDKPFTVTEFNYVYPNRYRGEGGALMGAYASLQGFDGLYRFSWAHSAEVATRSTPIEGFDTAQDPITHLSEHIIGMLWRRGDLPAFSEEAVYQVDRRSASAGERFAQTPPEFPDHAGLLGLSRRISSSFVPDHDLPADINKVFDEQTPRQRYTSEIGAARVIIDQRGDFLATTPYSQVAVIQKESLAPEFVSEVTGGPATILAGSLDEQALPDSKRILVLHLTNALSEGMRFAEKGQYTLLDRGSATKLVRAGSARIQVPLSPGTGQSTVYALGLDGGRIAEVPHTIDREGRLSFLAETLSQDRKPSLAYEIIRE